MLTPNHFIHLLLAGLITLASASLAQSADEPERLAAMRKIYEAEIVKLKIPILGKLITDLAALELELTRANKLEEAVKARAERTQVEATLKSLGAKVASAKKTVARQSSKPSEAMKAFSIPMSEASLQGRLKRPGSSSYITSWTTTTCLATWSGGQIIPGMYDVYIDYDTAYLRGGGELKFEELSQDFHCVIPADHTRTTMKVGTFKLGSALGFTIRAKTKNPYGILRLYGVTFKPSAQQ